MFARVYMQISANIANNTFMATVQLGKQANENDQVTAQFRDNAGVQVFRMNTRHNTVYEDFDTIINWVPNFWYCVEIEMKAASGGYGTLDGEARMWVDGVLGTSSVNRNFGNADIDRFRVGTMWNNINTTIDIFTDCAAAGDARIGCAVDVRGGYNLVSPAIAAFFIQ
ncbi:unnamed protein product [marine sediment metagenome]|uniref:Uncharacterized protein n=1 Tax=marine sediment metagenome TaxID=412755 RepID=X1PBT7_9ZZZZ